MVLNKLWYNTFTTVFERKINILGILHEWDKATLKKYIIIIRIYYLLLFIILLVFRTFSYISGNVKDEIIIFPTIIWHKMMSWYFWGFEIYFNLHSRSFSFSNLRSSLVCILKLPLKLDLATMCLKIKRF